MNKHRHIVNIGSTLQNIFDNTKCITVFRKSISLKQIIRINIIEKKIKNPYTNQTTEKTKRSLCCTAQSVCCRQVTRIFLLEYAICCKIRHVEKSETSFNLWLNHCRTGVKKLLCYWSMQTFYNQKALIQ